MKDIKNLVWQEAYRPEHVRDVISPFKEQILNAMKNPLSIQNFIFYSRRGGTGKTSMSKAIVNDLQCDVLSLNASDERSIETIRNKVKTFMVTKSANTTTKKCILMDEGEQLTREAALALKGMLEEFAKNCFIILTTNNLNKLPEPLRNRFKVFTFVKPDKDEIKKYLINICENENLQYDNSGIEMVIEQNYPSIRGMVNVLQDLYNQNVSVITNNIISSDNEMSKVWNDIKLQKYLIVKQKILEDNIDCEALNNYIFTTLIGGDLDLKYEIGIIPLLAKNERDFKLGADKTIIFIGSLISIIKVLRA